MAGAAAAQRREVWEHIVARLDGDPAAGLNTAWECCGRWAGDRGRLALIQRNADGTSARFTFYDLDRAAARAARMFADAGLRPGDRVAAVLSRQPEAWITALAAWRSGLVLVPLFYGFGTEALAQRLRPSAPRAIVVGHAWRAVLAGALDGLGDDVAIFTVTGPRGTGLERGDRSFWAELERCAPDGPVVETAASDTATIMFTSGTSGTPKGCLMPHSAFVSLLPFVDHVLALGPEDLLFSTSDPGWSYGLYTTGCAVWSLGLPRVVYGGDFDPAAWLKIVEEEQATFVAGAPSAFRRLVSVAQRDGAPASLVGATCAGEPLDAGTVDRWHATTGTALRDGYGLSEVGMVLGNLGGSDEGLVAGALECAIPGFEVLLVDGEHREVPDGVEGTIAIRRPPFQLSTGYLNDDAAWAARWDGDLFVTEDLARREDGRFWFSGRADDVIVTSGYNVGPAEIAAVLLEHPGVAEAAAVAAPDPARGSIVRAVIVRASGAPSTDILTDELRSSIRSRIGRHASPRIIDYVDTLPRTETGKLRRAVLREVAP
ncbi:MAG TPA: AMP-binding protein [Baekduia sp.]